MFVAMRHAFGCAFALIGATAVLAQTRGVRLEIYGTASDDDGNACFYDANGIVRWAVSHMRVWTKCLRRNRTKSTSARSSTANS
jgi:hypothetical protein